MRKNFFIIIVVSLLSLNLTNLFAKKTLVQLNNQIRDAFIRISDEYVKKFPLTSTKKGLAVLPFNEESEIAKKKGLGNIVREIISEKVLTSQVFYLVDRDTLQQSLKEFELSLTGLVDEEKMVKAGRLVGVQVFLTGSISEVGNSFQITIKLIDVETGTTVAMENVLVDQEELIIKKREIEFAYIAKYGLGINFQQNYWTIKQVVDGINLWTTDVFLNYRAYLWLNFKLGVSSINMEINYKQMEYEKVYRDINNYDTSNIKGNLLSYNGGKMEEVSPYFGFDYNITPSEKFTIGFGIGCNFISHPVLNQDYDPLAILNTETTNIVYGGPFSIIQQMYEIMIFRFEIKPQYFISPRMTIGLYTGCVVSTKWKLYKTIINNEYSSYPGEPNAGKTYYEKEMSKKYLNIPVDILADGKSVNDITLQGAFMVGISFNFYF
jgi:TolB-like protein